jgi:hypothetical protein
VALDVVHAVGAESGKASCHSDYVDAETARELQRDVELVKLEQSPLQ